ncbi:MAG: HAMP domain-containing histidine kinase [Lachnospiraceae bacterium]|nr:HAMP domain-containing histidine kinase [Lachnospiraceae bacterium]
MRNRLFKNYYSRFVINVVFASVILFAFTSFLVYNTIIIEDNKENVNLYSIILFLAFGVIVFALTFIALERKRNHYLDEIFLGIERISKGDLNSKIEAKGDDELSLMALNINLMQDTINKLIISEKESEKTKNELITNIAHDLRTPLTSIIGYLDILVNNKTLDEEKKNNYLSIAFEKSKKLEVLIEDLFSFTKMNYGDELVLKKERIDIVELLNQLLSELYPLFETNNLEYSLQSNVSSKMMDLDPKLIVRLFENLINNAIKYGKDGKNIVVKLKSIEELSKVEISVINFGKLIPEQSLKKIFDKFYRVDNSRTSETGGTGLGLAIAKSIVELHGGEITVKSDTDGTVFKVTLKSDL